MLILFDSLTGNVGRFIKKLPVPATPIQPDMKIQEPFLLITYTTGLGKIPERTLEFLAQNHAFLKGISSSGNKNFGQYFALAADEISKEYGIPIVSKFELSGTSADVEAFMKGVNNIEAH